MADEANHTFTDAGNMRGPSRRQIVQWVLDAWSEVPCRMISDSFCSCAITVNVDGSEDESIRCFKKGELCEAGLERLKATIESIEQSQVGNPFENITESDVEDASPEDLNIDHDDVDVDIFGI